MSDAPVRPTIDRVALAACAIVAGWSAWSRYQFLAATPSPVGVDGYYYLIQVRSLLEGGGLYYPSSPLGLWLMAAVGSATGPVTAVKLVAALAPAAAGLFVYGSGRRLGAASPLAAVASIAAVTSPSSLYLSAEFVKTAVGLTLAVATWWVVLGPPRRRRTIVAALLVVGCALTHKLAFVLAAMGATAVWWPHATPARRWATVLVGVGLVVALGVLFPERFVAGRDVSLLTGLVCADAHWLLPALIRPGGDLFLGYDALLAASAGLAGFLLIWNRPGKSWRFVATLIVLVAVVCLPWLDVSAGDGLGYRLRIVVFLPGCVLLAWVLHRATTHARLSHLTVASGAACLCVAMVVFRSPVPTDGVVQANLDMVAAITRIAEHTNADEVVVIPERHLVFMTTWTTRRRAQLRPTGISAKKRVRVLPLAHIRPTLAVAMADLRNEGSTALVSLHRGHKNGLVLVREADWQDLMARVPREVAAHYQAWPTL